MKRFLSIFFLFGSGFALQAQETLAITDFIPKTGIPGDAITITGKGFSSTVNENQVAFGNDSYAPAFEVNSTGTELKVRVPADGISGKIQVRVSDVVPSTVTYEVVFTSTWSSSSHPTNFPAGRNPHFTSLIGGTHNSSLTFWAVDSTIGQNAAAGMESMAEQGTTSSLMADVQAAITAGTAERVLSGGGIRPAAGTVRLTFEISQDFPQVTLVSMLAPSPDWFVGVGNLSLFENRRWVQTMTVQMRVYDAGTEQDNTVFSLGNTDQNPKVPISRLSHASTDFSDGNPPIGTMVFTLQTPLSEEMVTSAQDFLNLSTDLATLRTRNDQQSDSLRTHSDSIASYQVRLMTQTTGIDAMRTRNDQQSDSLRTHSDSIASYQVRLMTQTTGIDAMRTRNDQQSDSLRTHSDSIASYHARISALVDEINTLKAQIETPDKDISTIFNIPNVAGELYSYPNPASRSLHFANLAPNQSYSCKIYAPTGQQVLSGTIRSEDSLDISSLAAGQYIITLANSDGHETLRSNLLVK